MTTESTLTIKIAIMNITSTGYVCKRPGLSGEMISVPFSGLVLIEDLGVCKIVAKIFFFKIIFVCLHYLRFWLDLELTLWIILPEASTKAKMDLQIKIKICLHRTDNWQERTKTWK